MYHSSYSKRLLVAAIICLSSVISFAAVLPDTLLAFPGAEGFGKYCSGGRGGKVVYVTTLEDDANGETVGSLRWAVKQYPNDPLTVCFAVTGEIRLVKDLRINRQNYTIAGQTAPGVGIVITHNKVNCGGSENFIIRNIRFRAGNEDVNGNFMKENAFGAENCSNFILDHCDFGWSAEENINTFDGHFFTVQYCIVHEGLYNSGHPKGARGYGCQWGGSPATYHHNLLAHNNGRSCRFNGARNNDRVVYLDYINNVNFNYFGGSSGCHGGENTCDDKYYNGANSGHEVNFVNNYYIKGPNTTNTRLFVVADDQRSGATSRGPSQWYIHGNIFEGEPSATNDNWSAVTIKTYTKEQARVDTLIRTKTPWWDCNADRTIVYGRYDFDSYAYASSAFQTAEDAYQTVLDTAGCFPRDHVEKRLIEETRNNTFTYKGSKSAKKGIIDSPSDAEGFYSYRVVEPLIDSDADGMPDIWEVENGCNPKVADNNKLHASGYTMLEVYLDYALRNKSPMDDGYVPANDVSGNTHITYTADDTSVFSNPERGFTDELGGETKLSDTKNHVVKGEEWYFEEYSDTRSLVMLMYYLYNYKTKDLSEQLLQGFDEDMQVLRKYGFKCVLRFAYDWNSKNDAELTQVQRHLAQLKPYLAKNADVIYVLEAGFVGQWGEWYYSANFGDETQHLNASRRAVVDALLDAVPANRFLLTRYPLIKTEYLGDERPLTAEEAFTDSARAKMGHHNDAFLNIWGNDGTYGRDEIADDPVLRQYIASETLFVPNGGETNVEDSAWAQTVFGDAPVEMSRYHWSFCGSEYSEAVTDKWRTSGIFDELNRKMGYRYQLVSAELPEEGTIGGQVAIEIKVRNVGYAPLYNERHAYLVLKNATDSFAIRLDTDPRRWMPNGATTTINEAVLIPNEVPEGDYNLYLHLPDASSALKNNPRYAVRFANVGTWDAQSGMNSLLSSIHITAGSEGWIPVEIEKEPSTSRKIIVNGQLFILRGDRIYTVQGQEVYKGK